MNEIFDSLVKANIEKFKSDFKNLSRQVFVDSNGELIHPGEFGMYRERIVKDFLKPFLPSRLDIGTGFIITSKGRISTQCDIIVYDRNSTPVIENTDQRFFPIECVVGVIEVKSNINLSQLKEALLKLAKIKDLRNDIESSKLFQFKDTTEDREYNTFFNVKDQLATLIICENIAMNDNENIEDTFNNIYGNIDKSLIHNMILDISGKCFMYKDENNVPIYYSHYAIQNNKFINLCILPSEKGYKNEHILVFLNYFYMLISSVSVMNLEITYYLGEKRKHNCI